MPDFNNILPKGIHGEPENLGSSSDPSSNPRPDSNSNSGAGSSTDTRDNPIHLEVQIKSAASTRLYMAQPNSTEKPETSNKTGWKAKELPRYQGIPPVIPDLQKCSSIIQSPISTAASNPWEEKTKQTAAVKESKKDKEREKKDPNIQNSPSLESLLKLPSSKFNSRKADQPLKPQDVKVKKDKGIAKKMGKTLTATETAIAAAMGLKRSLSTGRGSSRKKQSLTVVDEANQEAEKTSVGAKGSTVTKQTRNIGSSSKAESTKSATKEARHTQYIVTGQQAANPLAKDSASSSSPQISLKTLPGALATTSKHKAKKLKQGISVNEEYSKLPRKKKSSGKPSRPGTTQLERQSVTLIRKIHTSGSGVQQNPNSGTTRVTSKRDHVDFSRPTSKTSSSSSCSNSSFINKQHLSINSKTNSVVITSCKRAARLALSRKTHVQLYPRVPIVNANTTGNAQFTATAGGAVEGIQDYYFEQQQWNLETESNNNQHHFVFSFLRGANSAKRVELAEKLRKNLAQSMLKQDAEVKPVKSNLADGCIDVGSIISSTSTPATVGPLHVTLFEPTNSNDLLWYSEDERMMENDEIIDMMEDYNFDPGFVDQVKTNLNVFNPKPTVVPGSESPESQLQPIHSHDNNASPSSSNTYKYDSLACFLRDIEVGPCASDLDPREYHHYKIHLQGSGHVQKHKGFTTILKKASAFYFDFFVACVRHGDWEDILARIKRQELSPFELICLFKQTHLFEVTAVIKTAQWNQFRDIFPSTFTSQMIDERSSSRNAGRNRDKKKVIGMIPPFEYKLDDVIVSMEEEVGLRGEGERVVLKLCF